MALAAALVALVAAFVGGTTDGDTIEVAFEPTGLWTALLLLPAVAALVIGLRRRLDRGLAAVALFGSAGSAVLSLLFLAMSNFGRSLGSLVSGSRWALTLPLQITVAASCVAAALALVALLAGPGPSAPAHDRANLDTPPL